MKATGIVRRIDDLGRVVIPKEIRRTLRIREGDPLEIFTDREGEVILKKYSPIGELGEFATEYCEALYETLGNTVIISDRDTIISVAGGSKKEYMDRRVSPELEKIMESKETYVATSTAKPIRVASEEFNSDKYSCQIIAPIVTQGDPIGSVIVLSKEPDATMGETERKVIETAAAFLSKQMES